MPTSPYPSNGPVCTCDRYVSDSNLVFLVRKSYWPDYHYLLPWDCRTGEYGGYGTDLTTRLIDWAASNGFASHLRTCSNDAMTRALEMATDEALPLAECVRKVVEADEEENTHLKLHAQ